VEKVVRTCRRTGRQFTYTPGPGRPPLYHPAVRDEVRAEQMAAANVRYRRKLKRLARKLVAATRAKKRRRSS
jgi:hypothetical protein